MDFLSKRGGMRQLLLLESIFVNSDFNNELQIEMSKILISFIESNKHLFSSSVLRAMIPLKNELTNLEGRKEGIAMTA